MKAKVTGEYYRLYFGNRHWGHFKSPHEACAEAYRELVEDSGKPGWRRAIEVQRVTTHESVPIWSEYPELGSITETVTGRVTVPAPGQIAEDVGLSRYHPVNGWSVPETLEIKDYIAGEGGQS